MHSGVRSRRRDRRQPELQQERGRGSRFAMEAGNPAIRVHGFWILGLGRGSFVLFLLLLFPLLQWLTRQGASTLATSSHTCLPWTERARLLRLDPSHEKKISPCGGCVSPWMSRNSDSPGTEFKIAAAGPTLTLAIALACVAVRLTCPLTSEGGAVIHVNGHVSGIVLAWVASINAPGLVFNLISFPRRRTDRAGDRLAGDRGPQARAHGCCLPGPGLLLTRRPSGSAICGWAGVSAAWAIGYAVGPAPWFRRSSPAGSRN